MEISRVSTPGSNMQAPMILVFHVCARKCPYSRSAMYSAKGQPIHICTVCTGHHGVTRTLLHIITTQLHK